MSSERIICRDSRMHYNVLPKYSGRLDRQIKAYFNNANSNALVFERNIKEKRSPYPRLANTSKPSRRDSSLNHTSTPIKRTHNFNKRIPAARKIQTALENDTYRGPPVIASTPPTPPKARTVYATSHPRHIARTAQNAFFLAAGSSGRQADDRSQSPAAPACPRPTPAGQPERERDRR